MTSQTLKRPAKTVAELAQFQRRRRLVLALLITAAFVGLLFVGSASTDHEFHEHVEGFGICVMLIADTRPDLVHPLHRRPQEQRDRARRSLLGHPQSALSVFRHRGGRHRRHDRQHHCGAGLRGDRLCRLPPRHPGRGSLSGTHARRRLSALQGRGPPLLPEPQAVQRKRPASVRPQVLYRTFCDGLLFLAAYPFFETIEYLQNHGTLPVLVRLF